MNAIIVPFIMFSHKHQCIIGFGEGFFYPLGNVSKSLTPGMGDIKVTPCCTTLILSGNSVDMLYTCSSRAVFAPPLIIGFATPQ